MAELEATQGRHPAAVGHGSGKARSARCPWLPSTAPTASLGHPSAPSITGVHWPQSPTCQDVPAPQTTLLLHHPSKQEMPLSLPRPRAELEELEKAEFICVLSPP